MEIREISREALKPIYDQHMVQDFPADELNTRTDIEEVYDR